MDPATIPRLHPGIEVHHVEDGSVVYLPETDQVHFLNAAASFVLELCDGRHDVRAIVQELEEVLGDPLEFDVVATILQPLRANGVVDTEGRRA